MYRMNASTAAVNSIPTTAPTASVVPALAGDRPAVMDDRRARDDERHSADGDSHRHIGEAGPRCPRRGGRPGGGEASSVEQTTKPRTLWRRWVLPAAAVLGVGPWGGIAGAALFLLAGEAVGVTFSDPGFFNYRTGPFLWLLLGLTLGWAVAAYVTFGLVERSPRLLGVPVAAFAGLSIAPTLLDPSGWDWLYLALPGIALAAVVVWLRSRRRDR